MPISIQPSATRPARSYPGGSRITWTSHARSKLRQYGLSPTRVLRVIRRPQRVEEGIAPETVAVMQPTSPKHTSEIWAMYQTSNPPGQLTIITAWRYPAKSPVRSPIPIPEDIRALLHQS
ncbi:MAG: hypothetical protein AAB817_00025 [Patescibacteria group bacterium]